MEAEGFARAVTACFVTLDVLPPEWQRRALAMINAAFPKPEQPNPLFHYGQLTTTTTSPKFGDGWAQQSIGSPGDIIGTLK